MKRCWCVSVVAGRELTRITWPLPWWSIAGPAVLIAAVCAYFLSTSRHWAYIDPARLSGLAAASVSVSGVAAALAAAWIAERFANRRSPLAWPVAPRADGRMILRLAGVASSRWALALLLTGSLGTYAAGRSATGGHFYVIETAFGIANLAFFTVSGLCIGLVGARWHAPLWAAAWAAGWLWVVPVYSGPLFPYPSKGVEAFLFPQTTAGNHGPVDEFVLLVLLVWWVLVVAAFVLVAWAWQRLVAGMLTRIPMLACALSLPGVAALGVGLAHALPSPILPDVPQPAVCEPLQAKLRSLDVCVTAEQRPILGDVRARLREPVDRIGPAWPTDIRRIASFDVSGKGRDPEPGSLGINVSSHGARSVAMDVGVGLAGLDRCPVDGSAPMAVNWALAFGRWLARDPEARAIPDPQDQSLSRASDDEVRRWYAANADALRACAYTGSGPS